jgi:hypothetical protein
VVVVGLREGRAVVLGRRGPRVTASVVGYGRRIVHDVWSRSDWSLNMRMIDGLHLLETMTSASAPDRHCQEPRAANMTLLRALAASPIFYKLTKSHLLFLQQVIDLFVVWRFFWHAAQITMAVSPCPSQC